MNPNDEFERIAMVHLTAVYRAAIALCGNPDLAEDLVQNTMLKAYERFGSFTQGTHCKAWLLCILRNTWIDHLRKRNNKPTVQSLEEDMVAQSKTEKTTWTDANDLLENFTDEQVIKALQRLPEDQRLTLYLVDVEQLSQDEIATITEVAVGTVKSRASRARSALKQSLQSAHSGVAPRR